MTTLYLKATPDGIEIAAEIDSFGHLQPVHFKDYVRLDETFGGYRYEELMVIAATRGQMDADELRV